MDRRIGLAISGVETRSSGSLDWMAADRAVPLPAVGGEQRAVFGAGDAPGRQSKLPHLSAQCAAVKPRLATVLTIAACAG